MKKGFISGFICATLLTTGLAFATNALSEVYTSTFPIKINGQAYNPEMPILNYQGRTYLALREFGTVTGNTIDFQDNTIIVNTKDYSPTSNTTTSSAISINAQQLCKEYNDNEVKADGLYKDKLLEITGKIDDISKDILGNTYISFSDGSQYSFKGIKCYFDDVDEIAKITNLSKGNKITIQGRCDGKSILDIEIKDCILK